jgi:hypothetical protein
MDQRDLVGVCSSLDEELNFLSAKLRNIKTEVGDGIGRLSSLAVVLGECGSELRKIRNNSDRLKAELIFCKQ